MTTRTRASDVRDLRTQRVLPLHARALSGFADFAHMGDKRVVRELMTVPDQTSTTALWA